MTQEPTDVAAEASRCADQLLAATGEARRTAAGALSSLGISARGSIRTRGSIRKPASDRLPSRAKLQQVVDSLRDRDPRVRAKIALALAEWGGQDAASALAALLSSEPDQDVRLHYITALRIIGGADAVDALGRVLESGAESERDAALRAIEELLTGGAYDDTEPPPPATTTAPPVARTRGRAALPATIRTRGGRPDSSLGGTGHPAEASDPTDQIVTTLRHVRADAGTSEYLRLRAGDVLRSLGG